MKKTALQQFIETLPIRIKNYYSDEIEKFQIVEREQIIDSYKSGFEDGFKREEKNGELFYVETYGEGESTIN